MPKFAKVLGLRRRKRTEYINPLKNYNNYNYKQLLIVMTEL
jgi:hypothetical protein